MPTTFECDRFSFRIYRDDVWIVVAEVHNRGIRFSAAELDGAEVLALTGWLMQWCEDSFTQN